MDESILEFHMSDYENSRMTFDSQQFERETQRLERWIARESRRTAGQPNAFSNWEVLAVLILLSLIIFS